MPRSTGRGRRSPPSEVEFIDPDTPTDDSPGSVDKPADGGDPAPAGDASTAGPAAGSEAVPGAPSAESSAVAEAAPRWRSLAVAGVVVAGLAGAGLVVSRAGPDGATPVPSSTTGPATTALSENSSAAVGPVDRVVIVGEPTELPTTPIPGFDADLPADLPGVISGFDTSGTVLVIDRREMGPQEVRVGLVPVIQGATIALSFDGAEPVGFAQELAFARSSVAARGDDGSPAGPPVDLRRLGTSDDLLVIRRSAGAQSVTLVSLAGFGTVEDNNWRWDLPGLEPEVVGLWEGQLLVHQGGRTWLLAANAVPGSPPPVVVGDGPVVSWDGRYLVRLVCDQPARCELVVGTPDQPARHRVPAPAVDPTATATTSAATSATTTSSTAAPIFAGGTTVGPGGGGEWAGSAAVSPDGTLLAATVRSGPRVAPVIVDLATGEVRALGGQVEPDALMAWSPDGAWLAYESGDGLLIQAAADDRSHPVALLRQLVTLRWG